MVQPNVAKKEVLLKIIYYGPTASGKKSNFQVMVEHIPSNLRSELKKEKISEENTIHTLEYLPESLQLAGMKVRCLLHTISYDVEDVNTLKEYFQSLDGLVLVLDSQSNCEADNLRALNTLEKLLTNYGYNITEIPLVFQWNKQDLPGIKTIEEWDSLLNERSVPSLSASARSGEGVLKTLETIVSEVCSKVEDQLRTPSMRLPKKKLGEMIGQKAKKEEEISEEIPKVEKEKTSLAKKITFGKKPQPTPDDLKSKTIEGKEVSQQKDLFEFTDEDNEERISQPDEKSSLPKKPLLSKLKLSTDAKSKENSKQQVEELFPPYLDKKPDPETLEKASHQLKTEKEISDESPPDKADSDRGTIEEQDRSVLPKLKSQTDISELTSEAKEKSPLHIFSKKTIEDPIATLKQGLPLENVELDVLDLSEQMFEKPIHIVRCQISKILAKGCDFKHSLTIEDSAIQQVFDCSGEIASLFREVVRLRNVEIPGDINWDNCIFSKGLIIEDSRLDNLLKMQSAVCEGEFSLINSKFGGIVCQEGQFRGKAVISSCEFKNLANFQRASFYLPISIVSTNFQRVHFMDVYCKDVMELARCIFEKSGNFGKIQCDNGISLEGCVCNGYFNMGEAYLKNRSGFHRTEFCNDASFTKLHAEGSLIFEKATFASLADFSAAYFAHIDMMQTIFYGMANFQEAMFTENLSLVECSFEQRTHFGRAIFMEQVDFRMTEWKDRVSFANIMGDYILLDREQVENKLLADHIKDYTMAKHEYKTLKNIFERQKQSKNVDWAHYQYRRAARKECRFSIFHPIRTLCKFSEWLFLDVGCQYGTKPARLLLFSLVLIAIFAAINGYWFSTDLNFPEESQLQKWISASWHSFVTFTPSGLMHWKNPSTLFPWTRDSMVSIILVTQNLTGCFFILLFLLTFTRRLLQERE